MISLLNALCMIILAADIFLMLICLVIYLIAVELPTERTFRKREIRRDIRKEGFRATGSLIRNILQIDWLTGRKNTLHGVCAAAMNGYQGYRFTPVARELVEKVVEECRKQELRGRKQKSQAVSFSQGVLCFRDCGKQINRSGEYIWEENPKVIRSR